MKTYTECELEYVGCPYRSNEQGEQCGCAVSCMACGKAHSHVQFEKSQSAVLRLREIAAKRGRRACDIVTLRKGACEVISLGAEYTCRRLYPERVNDEG